MSNHHVVINNNKYNFLQPSGVTTRQQEDAKASAALAAASSSTNIESQTSSENSISTATVTNTSTSPTVTTPTVTSGDVTSTFDTVQNSTNEGKDSEKIPLPNNIRYVFIMCIATYWIICYIKSAYLYISTTLLRILNIGQSN